MTDSVDPIVALVLKRRIPPAADVDHVICGSQLKSDTADVGGKYGRSKAVAAVLEALDDFGPRPLTRR